MRLIGIVKSEEELKKISILLQKEGIEHSYEFQPKSESEEPHFNLWIVDEDKLDVTAAKEIKLASGEEFIIRDQDNFPIFKIASDGTIKTKKGVQRL